ncbi:MAG: hypothetical protein RLZZ588_518, partial [Chloroflexota bacterium]
KHPIMLHPDVLASVETHGHLRKRIGIVLKHLGAHGRTTVVKSCRGQGNEGWKRSPLGGNNGMHFYLWWAHQGSSATRHWALPVGSLVIRAVRHHDLHDPLDAGLRSEYRELTPADLENERLLGRTWTDDQMRFIEGDRPVRIVHGRPGSGKTTVLLRAIEARAPQKVLYLTWSRELATTAREHLSAFAPQGVEFDVRDYLSLLGEICNRDVRRQSLAESQRMFLDNLLGKRSPRELGAWHNRHEALFAEMRAYLLGRAIPRDHGSTIESGVLRVSNNQYLELRQGGKRGINRAAPQVLEIARKLDAEFVERVFPELIAAQQACELLMDDKISSALTSFDRVVVDEVQDLTLREIAVVAEVCRAIGRARGHAPWFLAAGDEGQTVRPSGFDWGPFSDLVARRIGTPEKYQLDENLRCPARIAQVIDRAAQGYRSLGKSRRPGKQSAAATGQHTEAQLIHVDAKSAKEAIELLESVSEVDGVVVIDPAGEIPAWVPAELRGEVLSPAEAKGLEYQSVILLDAGRSLARSGWGQTQERDGELAQEAHRVMIDQLRVALSRATETLVAVDVEAGWEERNFSRALLEPAAPFECADLAEYFRDPDAGPEERVLARTKDARTLLEQRPDRAWRRACQAVRLLGHPDLPNSVVTPIVRDEAYQTLLATAARLLVDGPPPGVGYSDIVAQAEEALEELESTDEIAVLKYLEAWLKAPESSPFELLRAITGLGRRSDWLESAFKGVAQRLRQAVQNGATSVELAREFSGDVDAWLRLTGIPGDVAEESRRLRGLAVDVLLSNRKLVQAEAVLRAMPEADDAREGLLREAQEKFDAAAACFERAGRNEDALRNWRMAANWAEAARVAQILGESARQDVEELTWLTQAQELVRTRPIDLVSRLRPKEREQLRQVGRMLGGS